MNNGNQNTMKRIDLETNVLQAAKQRIQWAFEEFERLYISFSGGKDSTVMLHLVCEQARLLDRKVGLFFLDWEAQFTDTIIHLEACIDEYADVLEPYWICLPVMTDNACSMFEPTWTCWDEQKQKLWVRDKARQAISKKNFFPFYYDGITFEEFAPLFAKWYSRGERCGNFIGIRTQESLNRFRTITNSKKELVDGKSYTTKIVDECWNIYPIYDWKTEDIWIYNGKTGNRYNPLYDKMYKAGMTIHQMRIDEPFGDTSRRGLWLYQIVEPQMWAKIVSRVAGANTVNEYGNRKGNILGNQSISLPNGCTWEVFAKHIISTMPKATAENYKNKIAVYIQWYKDRDYRDGIPDEAPDELKDKVPSWKRICKALLKNDYWCKTLGFSVNKSSNYAKYMDLMRRRRTAWGIFDDFKIEQNDIQVQ